MDWSFIHPKLSEMLIMIMYFETVIDVCVVSENKTNKLLKSETSRAVTVLSFQTTDPIVCMSISLNPSA